jgi:hypothetical protein
LFRYHWKRCLTGQNKTSICAASARLSFQPACAASSESNLREHICKLFPIPCLRKRLLNRRAAIVVHNLGDKLPQSYLLVFSDQAHLSSKLFVASYCVNSHGVRRTSAAHAVHFILHHWSPNCCDWIPPGRQHKVGPSQGRETGPRPRIHPEGVTAGKECPGNRWHPLLRAVPCA